MFIVAVLIGFAVGFAIWFAGSYFIARFIKWGSERPQPVNEKALKAYEIVLCGILFLLSVSTLFFIARAILHESS